MFNGKITKAFVIGLAIATLSGFKEAPKPPVTESGAPKVVDQSGPRPEWASSDNDAYVQEGKAFYRVILDNQNNLTRGMDLAKNRGFAAIRESVLLKIGSAFGVSSSYKSTEADDEGADEAPDSAAMQQLATIAKGVHLPGVKQEASWWEKTMVAKEDGTVKPAYKIYVLVSIPTKFLNKAQNDAAKAAMGYANKTKNSAAKKALEETMEELNDDGDVQPANHRGNGAGQGKGAATGHDKQPAGH